MTGTPPDEFVQRLQSADVSRSWAGAGGAGSCLALAFTLTSHTGKELHEGPARIGEEGFCLHPDQRKPSG